MEILPILLASIAAFAWGSFYYSPIAAGKAWMKEMNMDPKKMEAEKGKMHIAYAMQLVFTVIMVAVMQWVLQQSGASVIAEALQAAVIIWLGFFVTLIGGGVLWGARTWKGWSIDVFYWLINLGIISIVLISV